MGWVGDTLQVAGSIYSGFAAEGNKKLIKEAKSGIDDIFKAQTGAAAVTQKLAADKSYNVMSSGIENIGFGTRKSALETMTSLDASVKKGGGMVTTGDAVTASTRAGENLYDAYKSSADQTTSAYDLSIRAGEVAYDESVASSELQRQDRLKDLESIPDNFFEGFFGG